jgi:O-antigen/teichoic acid export membrane protein
MGLAVSAVLLLAACLLGLGVVQLDPPLERLIWIGAAVTVAREASTLSKVMELATLSRTRYILMECGESLVGLAAGLSFCWYWGSGPVGMFYGMLIGAGLVLLFDSRHIIRRLRGGRLDWQLQRTMMAFAAPVALAFFAEYIIASADRLLVQVYLGAEQLGIYAVSYSIAERAGTAVFMALGIASYPLVVRALERDGARAARRQALENGELLMTIAIPAFGGFCIASGHIAAVLVGPAFAGQAAVLMPPIAAAVFLSALRAHYFSHVQHLTNRTWRLLWPLAPAAVVNLALNVLLLPRMGLMGGVWASVVAYVLALAISIVQARLEFALPFPTLQAGKATLATAVMCAALYLIRFPVGAVGLVLLVATGAALYGVLVLLFDIGHLRHKLLPFAGRLRLGAVRS